MRYMTVQRMQSEFLNATGLITRENNKQNLVVF